MLPVCVVRTPDGGIKYYDGHTPILVVGGGNMTINFNLGKQTVSLCMCRRCSLAYVNSESITFDEPSSTGIMSSTEGNA